MGQVIEININLVFTIINLIVLYLLMKKFLFGPILNVMEQEKHDRPAVRKCQRYRRTGI